ncbi:NADH-quinone oxidoreductase subunit H [Collinsella sp. AGMB00827]|uniref:NADH-quinone oxidoreductase subunit H n=1 Tax=Collinsella ureilytica TaxID=2869515 RepID=A0ABS7MKP4_9ACTN|nr:proton-conducting transporter membrane subunit [Collinsella urealyticum]MBY4797842.1 NADH-quinone oxidoreductase subunit H [Collinsella urealyticum]
MAMLVMLFAIPVVAAALLFFVREASLRDPIAIVAAALTAGVSVSIAATYLNTPTTIAVPDALYVGGTWVAVLLDLLLTGVVLSFAFRWKNVWAIALGLVQLGGAIWCGMLAIEEPEAVIDPLFIDNLGVVMILIVGVVGSLICVYALGYMKDHQAHEPADAPDYRHQFLALMFLFLSAMFVIILSDNTDWMLAGWEITTVCSFLMIGYTRTEEARKSALLQINLNMVGGIAFHAAVLLMHRFGLPPSLNGLITSTLAVGTRPLVLPLLLLSVAGLVKAAQMPFHRWLLGAMVAPTPTSALLHSSTMVKAGVFLLVKFAPLYRIIPVASFMVVGLGGITFVLCSFMAISQSNAKRVLAYSTVANLGLICACAGVGTAPAVWAAVFLIIFHTVSKSLLFLCVGTVEHRIGSRNIEDMDGLFGRLPHLTRLMMLGIMGMFVAPFGMLISKWATLVSFAETGNVVFLLLLAFGSAATFFFWAKWLGKLSGVPQRADNSEAGVHRTEWAAVGSVAALLLACCAGLPLLSEEVVSPYLGSVFGEAPVLIGVDNLIIMVVIVAFIAIVLLTPWGRATHKRRVPVYLGGQGLDADDRRFLGSMGRTMTSVKRNWYLEDIFGERLITRAGIILCSAILFVSLAANALFGMGAQGGFFAERPVMLAGPGLFGLAVGTLGFALIAPVAGCLLDGLDRKISARMQGRVGPRVLQPYYDVRKLLRKEDVSVNAVDEAYVTCALIFSVVAGGMFVSGSSLLMSVFLITLSTLFFIIAAYSARSPYADTGADRECLQVMSYEPMVLIMTVGFYTATGSFDVASLVGLHAPIIIVLAPIFLGMLFILTIKLRKSPFDLSSSHHAHQEIVKGITTEMSGRTLAKVEIMHWCESVLFLMWIGMFFIWSHPASWALAAGAVAFIWLFEIWIDNNYARVKWQTCLKLAWLVALVAGAVNLSFVLIAPFM